MKVKIFESGTIDDLENKINLFCKDIEKNGYVSNIKYKVFQRNGIGTIKELGRQYLGYELETPYLT